jgi:hypothetical protein
MITTVEANRLKIIAEDKITLILKELSENTECSVYSVKLIKEESFGMCDDVIVTVSIKLVIG